MSQTTKYILGFFTVLPVFLYIYYFIRFFSFIMTIIPQAMNAGADNAEFDPGPLMAQFLPLIIIMLILVVLALGLLVYYIIHVIRNQSLESTERVIWIIAFVMAGFIAFPIYYFMRIWKS